MVRAVPAAPAVRRLPADRWADGAGGRAGQLGSGADERPGPHCRGGRDAAPGRVLRVLIPKSAVTPPGRAGTLRVDGRYPVTRWRYGMRRNDDFLPARTVPGLGFTPFAE